jgi:hypothetical protein
LKDIYANKTPEEIFDIIWETVHDGLRDLGLPQDSYGRIDDKTRKQIITFIEKSKGGIGHIHPLNNAVVSFLEGYRAGKKARKDS